MLNKCKHGDKKTKKYTGDFNFERIIKLLLFVMTNVQYQKTIHTYVTVLSLRYFTPKCVLWIASVVVWLPPKIAASGLYKLFANFLQRVLPPLHPRVFCAKASIAGTYSSSFMAKERTQRIYYFIGGWAFGEGIIGLAKLVFQQALLVCKNNFCDKIWPVLHDRRTYLELFCQDFGEH
jgi:hypothetical protein